MSTLHVAPAEGEPFDLEVGDEPLVVGRAPSADVVLADRFVSRHHVRLFRQGDALLVEDLGSRNGTLVNGAAIQGPTRLGPGDVIVLSASALTVAGAGGEPAPVAPPEPLADRPLPVGSILRSASEVLAESDSAVATAADAAAMIHSARRLRLVNEIHQALARPLDLEDLLDLILDRVFDHLRPESGAIYLRRADGDFSRAAFRSLAGVDADVPISRTLAREVADRAQAALVLDARLDARFAAAESIVASGVRSLVAAPLLDAAGSLGLIVLSSRLHVRRFDEQDMELLTSLASAAALRIRNLELAEEAAERRRLEEELTLARRIQTALLPARLPELPGWELYAGNAPSRRVSGDYYEIFARGEGRECVLMVADVAGKGVGAALLTASLAALSAGPLEEGQPPAEVCTRLSRLLYKRTPPEKYATAFLAVLEPASGGFRYANAGHNPGLLLRASGEAERLGASGPPLGLLPAAAYGEGGGALAPGDSLVLYTDGVTEAADPAGEEYGLDRLTELWRRRRGEPLAAAAKALEDALTAFVGGAPDADDRTLVVVRRANG
jgi:serine phosphatase RsbU (regulator of sigma subunit)